MYDSGTLNSPFVVKIIQKTFGSFKYFSYLYYVIKMINMNKLVFTINENNCINFLKLKDMNESKLGGRGECIGSVSFGTKTFYKYDWDSCTGWAEVFQFVYNKNLNK